MTDILEAIEARLGGYYGTTDAEVRALIAMVRDGEKDRKLGAATRAAVKAHHDEHGDAFGVEAIADDIGHDTQYMPYVEGARILRAIATCLREEQR